MADNKISNLNEELRKSNERVVQAERRMLLKKTKEEEKQSKIEMAIDIRLGRLLRKYFPEVSNISLETTEAKNKIAFSKAELCISIVADDKEYVATVKKKARQKMMPKMD